MEEVFLLTLRLHEEVGDLVLVELILKFVKRLVKLEVLIECVKLKHVVFHYIDRKIIRILYEQML